MRLLSKYSVREVMCFNCFFFSSVVVVPAVVFACWPVHHDCCCVLTALDIALWIYIMCVPFEMKRKYASSADEYSRHASTYTTPTNRMSAERLWKLCHPIILIVGWWAFWAWSSVTLLYWCWSPNTLASICDVLATMANSRPSSTPGLSDNWNTRNAIQFYCGGA